MEENTLTDKDKKRLTFFRSVNGKIYYWVVAFSPLFLVIMGSLNLWSASKIGKHSANFLTNLVQSYFKGFEPNQTYDGIYLLALERFETALVEYCLALVFLVFFMYRTKQDRRRNEIITNKLKQAGEW